MCVVCISPVRWSKATGLCFLEFSWRCFAADFPSACHMCYVYKLLKMPGEPKGDFPMKTGGGATLAVFIFCDRYSLDMCDAAEYVWFIVLLFLFLLGCLAVCRCLWLTKCSLTVFGRSWSRPSPHTCVYNASQCVNVHVQDDPASDGDLAFQLSSQASSSHSQLTVDLPVNILQVRNSLIYSAVVWFMCLGFMIFVQFSILYHRNLQWWLRMIIALKTPSSQEAQSTSKTWNDPDSWAVKRPVPHHCLQFILENTWDVKIQMVAQDFEGLHGHVLSVVFWGMKIIPHIMHLERRR